MNNSPQKDLEFLVENITSPPNQQRQLRAVLIVALQDLGHSFAASVSTVDEYLDNLDKKIN